jgi:hypothetical protein
MVKRNIEIVFVPKKKVYEEFIPRNSLQPNYEANLPNYKTSPFADFSWLLWIFKRLGIPKDIVTNHILENNMYYFSAINRKLTKYKKLK